MPIRTTWLVTLCQTKLLAVGLESLLFYGGRVCFTDKRPTCEIPLPDNSSPPKYGTLNYHARLQLVRSAEKHITVKPKMGLGTRRSLWGLDESRKGLQWLICLSPRCNVCSDDITAVLF